MPFRRYVLCLVLIGSSTAASAQQTWETYVNPRYGAAADYPADLFSHKDPPPDNGDGQTFWTAGGEAKLSIYGSNNADGDTPPSYLAKYVDLDGVSFKRVTNSYYAISGMRDGKIYYERCNFPPKHGPLGCFEIEYPADQKGKWDAVVTRIGRSLKSGSP